MTIHLMQNLWTITDAAIMFCKENIKKKTKQKRYSSALTALNFCELFNSKVVLQDRE